LKDEEERARLARVFEQGLDRVAGYVLPVKRQPDEPGGAWTSGRWFLRSEHLYLIPGDSPIGYRLPLDSLPWAEPQDVETIYEKDPFAPVQPLAKRQLAMPVNDGVPAPPPPGMTAQLPPRAEAAAGVRRTVLCTEPLAGRAP